jgi:hypothetical protein
MGVLKDIAEEFSTEITEVTFAILLTLVMRPVGAYISRNVSEVPTRKVNATIYPDGRQCRPRWVKRGPHVPPIGPREDDG